MPNYYTPFLYNNPTILPAPGAPYYVQSQAPTIQPLNYWISVDGEMAARAWQMPPNLPPNTIIPLWDLDGQHVYFKSTDAYGRINPLKKGRVVFDDDVSNLSNGQSITAGESMASANNSSPVNLNFVTKEDFESLRHEIQDMIRSREVENKPTSSSISEVAQNQSKWKNRGDNR